MRQQVRPSVIYGPEVTPESSKNHGSLVMSAIIFCRPSKMTEDSKNTQKDMGEPASRPSAYSRMRKVFEVPGPVRQLFDKFPQITYLANELPQRSPHYREEHSLYIFTTRKGAQDGEPSFNPTCLKWQVCYIPAIFLCPYVHSPQELTFTRRISNLQAFNSERFLPQIMHHLQELSLFCYPPDRITLRPRSLPLQYHQTSFKNGPTSTGSHLKSHRTRGMTRT